MLPAGDVVSCHTETLTIVDLVFSKCFFPFLFKNIKFFERLRVESMAEQTRSSATVISADIFSLERVKRL